MPFDPNLPSPPAHQSPANAGNAKKWWAFWIAAFFVFVGAVVIFGDSDENSTNTAASATSTRTKAPAPTTPNAPAATTEAAPPTTTAAEVPTTTPPTTAVPTPTTSAPDHGFFLKVSAAVPSAIEGFPVPEIATQEGLEFGKAATANNTVMDNADYGLAPGITVADVRRWYGTEQPPGRPYGQWAWCETIQTGSVSVSHWWAKPGTNQMLGLLINEGARENGLPTVGIRITKENSGPC